MRPSKPHPASSAHIAVGVAGEEAALRHLSDRGFSLIARNWRPSGAARRLELDLVGKWEADLVFVEVKTRRATFNADMDGYPAAVHNFSHVKQKNMTRAAWAFLTAHDLWEIPCRFDLVCVTLIPGQQPRLDHYNNVVELGKTLDSGHASWQPW